MELTIDKGYALFFMLIYNYCIIKVVYCLKEKEILNRIKENPWAIEYIENPTEEMCLYAVSKAWNALKYIKEPSYEVIKKAIESKGWAIQFVKNPSLELQELAVEKDYDSIKYIKNPASEIQIISVKKDWSAIKYIENPSEEAELEGIKNNEETMRYIKVSQEKINRYIKINIKIAKYLSEEDLNRIEPIIREEVAKDEVDDKYMLDFLQCDAFKFDKVKFVHKYGSMKAKTILLDYKLSI